MAILSLAQRLPTNWLAFIDNTAGKAALRKGYGKDAFVNGMLAAFLWGTAARRGWRPALPGWSLKPTSPMQYSEGTYPREAHGRPHRRHPQDADYAANQAVDDLSDAIN